VSRDEGGILGDMTRTVSVAVVCVLAVVGVASVAQAEPAGKKARLQVLSTKPLAVRGVGFESRERVRVIATTDAQTHSKWTTATRVGVVNARFAMGIQPCGSYRIRAIGTRGTRVSALSSVAVEISFPRRPQLDCMPAGLVDR
jgi:hypothetical protein